MGLGTFQSGATSLSTHGFDLQIGCQHVKCRALQSPVPIRLSHECWTRARVQLWSKHTRNAPTTRNQRHTNTNIRTHAARARFNIPLEARTYATSLNRECDDGDDDDDTDDDNLKTPRKSRPRRAYRIGTARGTAQRVPQHKSLHRAFGANNVTSVTNTPPSAFFIVFIRSVLCVCVFEHTLARARAHTIQLGDDGPRAGTTQYNTRGHTHSLGVQMSKFY